MEDPIEKSLFLEGPAGTGKTTHAITRIQRLIEQGVYADEILLLIPQRSYTLPYEEHLDPLVWQRLGKGTVGGLAQRMVSLFWPLVMETSSYSFSEDKEPTFLTYEVAQYFMARIVAPLVEQGYFAALRLTRHRLYSQLLDNLNKATVNCIPLHQVHEYLRSDSGDDASRRMLFDDISRTINAYRAHCVKHNLLDFSLYNEVFWELLSTDPDVRSFMARQYRHLIYDNSEEDFPLAHDIVDVWLPDFDTVLIVHDTDGGYRKFLAASPGSARALENACTAHVKYEQNDHTPGHLVALSGILVDAIHHRSLERASLEPEGDRRFHLFSDRLHHDMVERVCRRVTRLVEGGHPPDQIAVISPFLSDSLQFALSSGLEKMGIAVHTHRPSRVLRDEPMTKMLLTLAVLAHPGWGMQRPSLEAVAHMLNKGIGSLDLVRATLLASGVYEEASPAVGLRPFEDMPSSLREQVTFQAGELYDRLRTWMERYAEGEELPIDHFFRKLFGEVISQPGFGLHRDEQAGIQVASVVESAQKFRQAVAEVLAEEGGGAGQAYIDMVREGVVSAFYEIDWKMPEDAVLLSPVHTFLLRNRVFEHQIWLDVSNPSWHKRIPQPLTNPYILSRDWEVGRLWSSTVEKHFEVERLERIVLGLIRRCSGEVYAYLSELSVGGQEQAGELFLALGRVKRSFVDTAFTLNHPDV